MYPSIKSLAILALTMSPWSVLGERYVPVSSAEEFQNALSAALPGDRIHLLNTKPLASNETFLGKRNGTIEKPITVEGQGIESGCLCVQRKPNVAALTIEGNNWILRNFSIGEGARGLSINGDHNLVESVTFKRNNVVNLFMGNGSSNNIIKYCRFKNSSQAIQMGDPKFRHQGNVITNNEFVKAVNSLSIHAISIVGNAETCCDSISNNKFQGKDGDRWESLVIQISGNDFKYYNNSADSVRFGGFDVHQGQRAEFKGNDCGKIEGSAAYCIYEDPSSNNTLVYADNNSIGGQGLANIDVIDDYPG